MGSLPVRGALAALAFLAILGGAASAQAWDDTREAEVRGLVREGGFYLALQKVARGLVPPSVLKPWIDRINEPSVVGTTVRDTLVSLPASDDPWIGALVQGAPAGTERDWVLDRRKAPGLVWGGKFYLSLFPVRMDLLRGVSMVLPNYDWSISYQDEKQMTVQALEKGYSATLHLRWIEPSETDVFDTARLVQMYAGFRPRYIVKKSEGDQPVEGDLVPVSEVAPQPLVGQPGVLEQIQKGLPDAWQIYAGRIRWYLGNGKILVVMLNVHIERNQRLADQVRALDKIGLLLDTLKVEK